jgi:hypothetical protein
MQFGNFLTDTPAQKAITSIGELPAQVGRHIYASDINRTTGFAVIGNSRSWGASGEWRGTSQAERHSHGMEEGRPPAPIMEKNAARGGTL